MKDFAGKVIAITGAGSGIGRALAGAFAERGARLALSDIDAEAVEQTAERARRLGAEARAARVDVAERAQVFAWADSVAEHFGSVNVIANNAGVSLTAPVSELKLEDFEWLMSINFWGVVHGTQAFLPHLIRSGDGHVVNVSSIFGMLAVPTHSAYNAAKFAVKGFTEALRMELLLEGRPVGVTSVHPGGISTNIARSGRHPESASVLRRDREQAIREFETRLARNSPEYCARQILRGVERNRARLLVGGDAKLIDLVVRWLPRGYQSLLVAYQRKKLSRNGAG
ncbi:MAG TPA: SDR family NAD(P)-dependent oxidoreductase [Polyangiaceae bacterium]|nr:SDR family NAD(P)-dependent oxidoreductase [Polyangiaceae bacterium]